MRYALILALALCVLAAQAIPQKTAARKIPCKTLEIAASCYWTRGRLSVAEGTPPWRMWKIGRHRVVAIYSGPAAVPPRDQRDSLNPLFPANLERVYRTEV